MSSSSPPNVGNVDLESVLNVRRRTLASIGESNASQPKYRYTDTIYIKREDKENSLFSIQSKILIFGELQLLYSIFERYTSNIIVHDDFNESNSKKLSFSTTSEESDVIDEDDTNIPPIVSTLRQTSLSNQSTSPPGETAGSPQRRQLLGSIGRSQTIGSTTNDYPVGNLEGKRYGSIELPNMMIIEILEILLRNGLELVDQSSAYDHENTLHQNFILSKYQNASQKFKQPLYSRTASLIGT